uniref:CHK domain-containing protein n=1 Tax=Panagrellus redivivus TaxID=6233 RepID=A0A7E4V7C2_PANRE
MSVLTGNTPVSTSPFTIGYVLEKLRNAGETGCDVENLESFHAEDITGGVAFFSEIYVVKFQWKKPASLTSVVVKVPMLKGAREHLKKGFDPETAARLAESLTEYLEESHKLEEAVYTFYSKTAISGLKLPKFFYSASFNKNTTEGVLIIEDLTGVAATTKMIPGLNDEQVCAIIEELAHLHAVSLQNRAWFEELSNLNYLETMITEFTKTALKLIDIDATRFEDLVHRFIPLVTVDSMQNGIFNDVKFGAPPVLTHGDLWASNILWARNSEGAPSNELTAIIDWQLARPGHPGIDIGRLLGLNTPAAYRRANTDRLLKLYHDKLGGHLETAPPMTLEQLKEGYNKSLVNVTLFISYGVPSYYKMESVVGSPEDPELQEELLDRCHKLFEDTLVALEN